MLPFSETKEKIPKQTPFPLTGKSEEERVCRGLLNNAEKIFTNS